MHDNGALPETQAVLIKMRQYLTKRTAKLSYAAIDYIVSRQDYKDLVRALDKAALSGDIPATKAAANDLARAVKGLLY